MARWCAPRPRACACSPPPSRLCVAARAYPSILARRRVPVYAWPPSSHGPHVCPSVFACAAFASRVGLRIRRWRVAPPERCATRSHPLSRPRRLISPPLSSSPPDLTPSLVLAAACLPVRRQPGGREGRLRGEGASPPLASPSPPFCLPLLRAVCRRRLRCRACCSRAA